MSSKFFLLTFVGLLIGFASPAEATQSVEHRLKVLEEGITRWERMPAGWRGPSTASASRFIESLREALSQTAVSDSAPATSERSFRSARGLALRAASVYRRGMQSRELQSVSAKAKNLLKSDMVLRPNSVGWALNDVLAWDSSRKASLGSEADWRPSTKQRGIVLELLFEKRVRKLRGALLAIARREQDPLRGEALTRLARWSADFGPDDVVDVFLVKLLGQSSEFRNGSHPVSILLERIESSESPLGPRAQEALRVRIAQLVIAADWRQAAIGIKFARGMSFDNQIPILLDGLNVWNQRLRSEREYQGLVRVRGDITRELQRVSGMKHGPEPGPWITWWIDVRQGKRPMPGSPEFTAAAVERAKEPVSTAGFFGLKPTSDRVTFIIDHSGSMDHNWGTTDRSRFEEAVDQMLRFLQGAEEGTKFNVILFDDVVLRSSLGLVSATPRNLERARKALLATTPEGTTLLRPAIELAMGIGSDGLPSSDTETLADTIVVLCDGETVEGSAWVQPFLERTLPLYPVIFHTVHVGPRDDGALNELARLSGGDFLRVGR